MDIKIKFIDGEAYVPLDHVVNLVVTAQNEVARTMHRNQEQMMQKQAIAAQAQQVGGNIALGLGRGPSIECGDTQFIPHEQDYRGLSR